jgi:hypothetical protein
MIEQAASDVIHATQQSPPEVQHEADGVVLVFGESSVQLREETLNSLLFLSKAALK